MDNHGFFRVRAYVPELKVGDTEFNSRQIIEAVKEAEKDGVRCMVFPELCVTGYTCGDLFEQQLLMKKALEAIDAIMEATRDCNVMFAIGAPVIVEGKRYNCAIMIYNGRVVGVVPKTYLPNYGEFYEKRWFSSGKNINTTIYLWGYPVKVCTKQLFEYLDVTVGIEICEDLWVPNPPSTGLSMAGAEIILNLSASDTLIGKHDYLVELIRQQSARCRCAYVYSSAGWGESSTDLVFSGKAIIGEDGAVFGTSNKFLPRAFCETRDIDVEKIRSDRARFNTFYDEDEAKDYFRVPVEKKCNYPGFPDEEAPEFLKESQKEKKTEEKLFREVDPYPFVPGDPTKLNRRCEEILDIQSFGLMKRLDAIGCKKAVVGISGGLDSTLALLVTVRAFDRLGIPRTGIIAVTMPGLATTSRTKNNAWQLMEKLGVTSLEIPIGEAVALHFRDIGQDPQKYDATYENSQARERTQILMDLANKENGIVVGTGDMSELALGWCTYNGDQMSMYGVNASVPKTLVRHLVEWEATQLPEDIARVLRDICDTPISPELVPSRCSGEASDEIGQKTEDLVGPYELHDFFLYNFLRNSFTPRKIFKLAKVAFKGKYDGKTILKWLKVFIKRFFSQQFKRSCMPDGPKVGSVNLSPRGDWRMPSDASAKIWLQDLEKIEENETV